MEQLPKGWEWSTIGDVASLQNGYAFKSSEFVDDGIPVVKIGNVQASGLCMDNCQFGPNAWAKEFEKFMLRTGDLLITMTGNIGRVAVIKDNQLPALLNQRVGRFVFRGDSISRDFFRYVLASQPVVDVWTSSAHGIAQSNISASKICTTRIPLPPLAEQERIVSAIEEHLSRLDAADASLRRALVKSEVLKKRVIVESVPVDNSSGWEMSTVGAAGRTELGRQRSPKFHTGPNMKPYLRVANVFENRIDVSDVMEMHFDDKDFEKYKLQEGDILLNEGQSPEFLGRPAIYEGIPPETAFTNSLIRFVAGEDVLPKWALLVFRRHMHARRFMQESRITTNIAHLALGRFRTVEFPVPPLGRQAAIVERADSALESIAAQAAAIRAGLDQSKSLRRSILAAAFTGQLVPQDPTDEPASVLLERIAAEKPAKKSRKKKAK